MEEGSNPAQTTTGIKGRPDLAMPFLTDAMIARLYDYGSEEVAAAGSKLFARGDRNIDFFVVLDGRVEIIPRVKQKAVRYRQKSSISSSPVNSTY